MAKVSRGHLQKNYDSFEEFDNYDDIYKLAHRLGFTSAREAWDANPFIQWSVDPRDFKCVDLTAYYGERMRRWKPERLDAEVSFLNNDADWPAAVAWAAAVRNEVARRAKRAKKKS